MEEESKGFANIFLYLPDLVVESLLKYLDEKSHLNLRILCKTTKHWIAFSKFLKKFQVPLNTDEDLEFAISSCEQWCNFNFTQSLINYDPIVLDRFVDNYKDMLKVINLVELYLPYNYKYSKYSNDLKLFSACGNLESLNISVLHFHIDKNVEELIDRNLKQLVNTEKDKKSNNVDKNLPNIDNLIFDKLKKLSIQTINFQEESDLLFYPKLLQSFPNLEQMLIPRPQGPPNITWVNLKEIQFNYIIQPVMDYLILRSKFKAKSNLKILDVSHVFSRHFGPLAEICYRESGTLLLNVNDQQVKYIFFNSEDVLQNVISIRENIDDRRPLCKWTNLEKMFIRTSRCDLRNYYLNGRDSNGIFTLPRLKSIHLVFDSMSRTDLGFVRLDKILSLLIRTCRPGVEELILEWKQFCHDTPTDCISEWDVIENLVGLRKLTLIGWGSRFNEDVFRINLTQLKLLIVK